MPRPRRRCKMDGIVKRVAVAVVLLTLLGVAACGGEEEPASPAWAKLAPEQIAEAKKRQDVVIALGSAFVPWRGLLAEFEKAAGRTLDGRAVRLGPGLPEAITSADIVVVADDHLLSFYQEAAGRLAAELTQEQPNQWAVALEAFGPESAVRVAVCGGVGTVRCFMAELRRTWPYPINGYRILMQVACDARDSLGVLCVGSEVRGPVPADQEDAQRRPVPWEGMPANVGREIVEGMHRRTLQTVPDWLVHNKDGHVLLLCGAGHVRYLQREFKRRGFDALIVIPFLASWELSLRRGAGDGLRDWWEVLPGVYRPPYATREAILRMSMLGTDASGSQK